MKRREFITLVGGAAAWPFVGARAQQTGRTRLIGVLMAYAESDLVGQSEVRGFRGALTKMGWTEGVNLRIEFRWGDSDTDKISKFAKELVDLRPDAILGQTTPVVDALAHETRTIPIVFVNVNDPVASGFAPRTLRMALLFNPATGVPLQNYMPSIQAAASTFSVEVRVAPVHAKDEIEGVIAEQARNPGCGLIVMPSAFNATNREPIITLAAGYRVPAIYYNRIYAESGGLISYGPDFVEQFRQAPDYINRILNGAKPAHLPVQAPTKYELVINLKAAKALGLDIPFHLQQRADDLIE